MSEDLENILTSVKFYELSNANVHGFCDEWKFKTLALIRKQGWGVIFEDASVVIPTEAEAMAEEASEAVKALYKKSLEPCDQILMGCSGVPLGLVKKGQGNARKAIEYLDMKYGNKTEADLTELLNAFTGCRLEVSSDDPDKWFLQLDAINEKPKQSNTEYARKDYEIKAQMLGSLPSRYEDMKTKLIGKEREFSVADVEKEIRDKWRRDFSKRDELNKRGSISMNVERQSQGGSTRKCYKKAFKGRCRKCGKQGHKATDCKSDKKGICFKCGEDGHYTRNCRNKGSQEGSGGTRIFVGMTECAMTGLGNYKYSAFLLDSGGSCHVVGSGDMLVDPETSMETIKVRDGTLMKAPKQGTLFVQAENGATIKLTRVQVVLGIVKDIISTGCLAMDGNTISMEGRKLTIKNEEESLVIVQMDEGSVLYHLKARVLGRHEVKNATKTGHDGHPIALNEGTTAKVKPININDACELYGHLNYGCLKPIQEPRICLG